MQAYILTEPGDTSKLQLTNLPKAEPESDEVIVRTVSISINPVDAKTRAGKGMFGRVKDENPLILGWDISGVIESVGLDVKDFKPGDEVFGMLNFPGHGRAYAEFVAAKADQIALKPSNISYQEAAAATLAPLTAYQMLSDNVKPGDHILIQAAGGGVGHFAIQIGKILGAHVSGTVSAEKADFVKSLGADEVIDYKKQSYESIGPKFDFVLEMNGGENLLNSIQLVKDGGRIITLPSGANLDEPQALAQKRNITLKNQLVTSNGEDMERIAGWLESGQLKAKVTSEFPFNRLPEAHLEIESGKTLGKIIVNL